MFALVRLLNKNNNEIVNVQLINLNIINLKLKLSHKP